jgi:hypothetical protein
LQQLNPSPFTLVLYTHTGLANAAFSRRPFSHTVRRFDLEKIGGCQ